MERIQSLNSNLANNDALLSMRQKLKCCNPATELIQPFTDFGQSETTKESTEFKPEVIQMVE